tara:strand:- start:5893 stop:7224 length:1332 start_codon:yes stop_codon:yes gene_type:complete
MSLRPKAPGRVDVEGVSDRLRRVLLAGLAFEKRKREEFEEEQRRLVLQKLRDEPGRLEDLLNELPDKDSIKAQGFQNDDSAQREAFAIVCYTRHYDKLLIAMDRNPDAEPFQLAHEHLETGSWKEAQAAFMFFDGDSLGDYTEFEDALPPDDDEAAVAVWIRRKYGTCDNIKWQYLDHDKDKYPNAEQWLDQKLGWYYYQMMSGLRRVESFPLSTAYNGYTRPEADWVDDKWKVVAERFRYSFNMSMRVMKDEITGAFLPWAAFFPGPDGEAPRVPINNPNSYYCEYAGTKSGPLYKGKKTPLAALGDPVAAVAGQLLSTSHLLKPALGYARDDTIGKMQWGTLYVFVLDPGALVINVAKHVEGRENAFWCFRGECEIILSPKNGYQLLDEAAFKRDYPEEAAAQERATDFYNRQSIASLIPERVVDSTLSIFYVLVTAPTDA